MRFRKTKLCWHYGGSIDPIDIDDDYVRKDGEVRYVRVRFEQQRGPRAPRTRGFHWWPGESVRQHGCPLAPEIKVDEGVHPKWVPLERWHEWAGEALELVEPAPWYWWFDWLVGAWYWLKEGRG